VTNASPESHGSPASIRRAAPFTFDLASDADDAEIRRLLREHPMPGAIRVSLEREPLTSLAATIEGDVHQTLIARTRATGTISGLAARSVRDVFVNGQTVRLGYLGQLRVGSGRQALRTLLDDGFAFCRTLHEQGDAPAYLVSLVADNAAARRLLVERHSATAPRFFPMGDFETFVIPVRRRRGAPVDAPEDLHIVRGSQATLNEIVACLTRNLRRYQFAPCWAASDFMSGERTRGLSLDDFAVAVDDGHVVGCAALWDQRAFKQVVVRGYQPVLRRTRPIVNLAARMMGLPRLPGVGEPLDFAYLSHLAVDEDRTDVLASLVAALVQRARHRGLEYVVAGFPDRHPFHPIVRRDWARRTYRSALYVACWEDGDGFVRSIDGRPGQPEVAVL
jgi:hypothetical protein